MAEIIEKTAVDNLIEVISLLSEEQKTELASKLRTTPLGIKAYSVFNYSLIDGIKLQREQQPTELIV